jgi:tetratricopeptide (TPR) repeat protein
MRFALCLVLLALPLLAQAPPDDVATLNHQARAAWRDYDYATAERLYRSALANDPNSGDANAGLVRTLIESKKLPEAQRAMDTALRVASTSAAVQAADGDLLFRQGKIEQAETAYRASLAIDDKLARGWYGLSRIELLNSYYRSARLHVTAAHEFDPDDPDIYGAWAIHLPRLDRRKALEHMVDHPGHLDADRLNALQSRLAWLIVLGNRDTWKLVSDVDSTKLKLMHIMNAHRTDPLFGRMPLVGAVALKVELNNKKSATLLVDTGSSGIVLKTSVANKAGLRQVYDIAAHGYGDEKAATGYLGWAKRLKVGPLEFENVPVTALDSRFAEDTDGLIGLDVFEQFLVTLNIKSSELDLDPLPTPPAEYLDKDGFSDRYVAPTMKSFYPIQHMAAHIFVPTSIDDNPPALFSLDTGAFDSQVDPAFVSQGKLMLAPDLVVRGMSGRVNNVFLARNIRIQFGRFVQDNFRMVAISMDKVSERETIGMAGILGFPLLSNFRLSIDYRDGLVNFDYLEPKNTKDDKKTKKKK